EFAHGVTVLLGCLMTVGIRVGWKALRQRRYPGALAGRRIGGQILSLLDGIVCFLEPLRISRIVVIRANRFRYAPVSHCHFRIKFGGVLERTRGFIMIEGIDIAPALVKKLLGFRIGGGNWMMQVTKSLHQSHIFGFGW